MWLHCCQSGSLGRCSRGVDGCVASTVRTMCVLKGDSQSQAVRSHRVTHSFDFTTLAHRVGASLLVAPRHNALSLPPLLQSTVESTMALLASALRVWSVSACRSRPHHT